MPDLYIREFADRVEVEYSGAFDYLDAVLIAGQVMFSPGPHLEDYMRWQELDQEFENMFLGLDMLCGLDPHGLCWLV